MTKTTKSNRIISTVSSYAREHYLYVQEIGTLKSLVPHVSRRKNLHSLLFFVVLKGKGQITIQNQHYSLSSGDCVWIDCAVPYAHKSSPDNPWSLMWVHFWGRDAKEFYRHYTFENNSPVFRPGNIYPFTNPLTLLYREQTQNDSLSELMSHKYLTDIVASIFIENEKNRLPVSHIPDKFLKIQSYLDSHFNEPLHLEEIAQTFYISKYHLSREYKKYFGITIGNYLLSQRISKAKSLLRFSDFPIAEIAEQCGFSNENYFSKVFLKEEHITPSKYRKSW